jgi:hypothetical protein
LKTLVFCTAWSDSAEHMRSRVGRWAEHHSRLPWPCSVELAVIGDGIAPEIPWPDGNYRAVNLEPHLGRPSHLDYPGWWRSFGYAATIAREAGCHRIWHVESDFFLASWRMIVRMNEIEQGWIAFWCPRHGFPETAIQVIAEEHFDQLAELGRQCREFAGRHAEHVIPFSTIICDMKGDRYGEGGTPPNEIPGLDFFGQCPGNVSMIYEGETTVRPT